MGFCETVSTSTSLVKGYIPKSHIKVLNNQKVKLLDQAEWTRNGHRSRKQITIKHSKKSLSTTEYITELPSNLSLDTGLNKHLYNINIIQHKLQDRGGAHFIGPAYSQIRVDYFHVLPTNTDDIFNKHSLARIVG